MSNGRADLESEVATSGERARGEPLERLWLEVLLQQRLVSRPLLLIDALPSLRILLEHHLPSRYSLDPTPAPIFVDQAERLGRLRLRVSPLEEHLLTS